MSETPRNSPVFSVNSTMLGISAQKSEVSPIKPDRMRVTRLDEALHARFD
jgi:hypothetical protein